MCVLGNPGHVMDQHDVVLVAPCSGLFQVSHRNGLAACHVDAGCDADVRDLVGAYFVDECIQLIEVDVTLEGMLRVGVVRFIDDDINKRCTGQFLVQACGGEVHVARYVVARRDQDLAQNVFGAAALVARNRVLVAVVLLDCIAQAIKIAATRVSFIAHHDAGPLPVAHRAHTRVGQQVDIDIFRAQQEGVVAGFLYRVETILAAGHLDQLDHLDFVGFGPVSGCHFSTSYDAYGGISSLASPERASGRGEIVEPGSGRTNT